MHTKANFEFVFFFCHGTPSGQRGSGGLPPLAYLELMTKMQQKLCFLFFFTLFRCCRLQDITSQPPPRDDEDAADSEAELFFRLVQGGGTTHRHHLQRGAQRPANMTTEMQRIQRLSYFFDRYKGGTPTHWHPHSKSRPAPSDESRSQRFSRCYVSLLLYFLSYVFFLHVFFFLLFCFFPFGLVIIF